MKPLKDSDFVTEPITGVEYNGRKYSFYPYVGRMLSPKGGLLGYIKTAKGKLHGRFYTRGQFFMFEPAPLDDEPWLMSYTVDEGYNFPDYGEQEKPEHWGPECPPGFIARRPDGDEMEVRYEPAVKGKFPHRYVYTKRWRDDYTGKPRELTRGGARNVSVEDAEQFIASEMERYQQAGWTVERLTEAAVIVNKLLDT